MTRPSDPEVIRELRNRAAMGVPAMRLDEAAVRAAGRRRLSSRRWVAGTGAAAAVALAVAATTTGLLHPLEGIGPAGTTTPAPSTATQTPAEWTCSDPTTTVLPTWAQAGFTPATRPIAHLVSEGQTMIAVPFGWPLHAPRQTAGKSNKILWVARSGTGPLKIVANEQTTRRTVTVVLPDGPGPSIVDMPAPGCWRFTLSWGNQHDTIAIRYLSTPA